MEEHNKLQWTILQAAVRHVQRLGDDVDKKREVCRFLSQASQVFVNAGKYDPAYQCRLVIRSIDRLGSVNAVYKLYKRLHPEVTGIEPAHPTPASNTGVTPIYQQNLEEYVNGKC